MQVIGNRSPARAVDRGAEAWQAAGMHQYSLLPPQLWIDLEDQDNLGYLHLKGCLCNLQ